MDTAMDTNAPIKASFVSMQRSGTSIPAAQHWIRYGLNANSFAVEKRDDPSYEFPANQLAYGAFDRSSSMYRRPTSDTLADQTEAKSRLLVLWADKYRKYEFEASLRNGIAWISQTATDPPDSTGLRITLPTLPPSFDYTRLEVNVTAELLTLNQADKRVQKTAQLLDVKWDEDKIGDEVQDGVVTLPIDLLSRGVRFRKVGDVVPVEVQKDAAEESTEERADGGGMGGSSDTEEEDEERPPRRVTFVAPIVTEELTLARFTPWSSSRKDCLVYGHVEAAIRTNGENWRLRKLTEDEREYLGTKLGKTHCTIGMCEVGVFNGASRNLFKKPPYVDEADFRAVEAMIEKQLNRSVRDSYKRPYDEIAKDTTGKLFDVDWASEQTQAASGSRSHTLQTLASSVLRDLVRRRCITGKLAEGKVVKLGVDGQVDDADVVVNEELTVLKTLVEKWGAALTTQHYIRFLEDGNDADSAEWIAESVADGEASPRAPDVMAAAAFSSCAYPYTTTPEGAPSPSNANWFRVRVRITAETNGDSPTKIAYDELFPGMFTYMDMNRELAVYDRLAPPPRSFVRPISGTPLATRDIATSTLPATWEGWGDIPNEETTVNEVNDVVDDQIELFNLLDEGSLCACIAPTSLSLRNSEQPAPPCPLCLEYKEVDGSSPLTEESTRVQYAQTNDAIRKFEALLLKRVEEGEALKPTTVQVVRASDAGFAATWSEAVAELVDVVRQLNLQKDPDQALVRLISYANMIAFEASASIDDAEWRAKTKVDQIIAPSDTDDFKIERLLLRSMLHDADLLDSAENEDDERGWSEREREDLERLVGELPDPFPYLFETNVSNKRARDEDDGADDGRDKMQRRSIDAAFERAVAECFEFGM